MKKVEHYTVVREPEGSYETHFNPSSGSGRDIGVEVASVVRNIALFCTLSEKNTNITDS